MRAREIAFFVALLAVAGVALYFVLRAASESNERARLQTDLIIEQARADSLSIAVASERTDRLRLFNDSVRMSAELRGLGQRLTASEATNISLTRAVADAEGRAEAAARTRTDTVFVDGEAVVRRRLGATFNDGPLSAELECLDEDCQLAWDLQVELVLVQAVAPDGRAIVVAESPDERVRVTVPEFELASDPVRPPFLSLGRIGEGVAWALGAAALLLTLGG